LNRTYQFLESDEPWHSLWYLCQYCPLQALVVMAKKLIIN